MGAGGGGEFGRVSAVFVRVGGDFPAWGFFGVVAGFAEAESVVGGGGATFVVGFGVVAVADGRVAVGGSAALVAECDEVRPRPRFAAGTPAAVSASRRAALRATVSRACCAAARSASSLSNTCSILRPYSHFASPIQIESSV